MNEVQTRRGAAAAHLAVYLLAACIMLAAPGAVAQTVTYQGVLLDNAGNAVADGAYDMQFELFDAASGGTPLWQESLPGVTVTDGMFSVNLGASTPLGSVFQDNAQVWLGVAADTGSGVVAFDPRVKLGAAPYAFDAQSLGGVSAADLEESAEIDSDVSAHDASGTAHANIRAEIDSDVSAHNASGTAHTDIRNSISSQLLQHSNSPTAHPDIRTEIDSDITAHNSNASAHSATLAPLSHTHAGGDITSQVASAASADSAATAASVPWTGITGIPGGFADDVDDVDGGVAASVAWSGITGVPAGFADGVDDIDGGDADTVDGLHASAFAPTTHNHAASQITSGTMDINRLPVGTTSGTVASGAHTHDGSHIASGTVPYARLPVGTTSGTVAAGDHTHNCTDYFVGFLGGETTGFKTIGQSAQSGAVVQTSSTRLTVSKAGLYYVHFQQLVNATGTSGYFRKMHNGGAPVYAYITNTMEDLHATRIFPMNAGDYIEFYIQGNFVTTWGGAGHSAVSMFLIK